MYIKIHLSKWEFLKIITAQWHWYKIWENRQNYSFALYYVTWAFGKAPLNVPRTIYCSLCFSIYTRHLSRLNKHESFPLLLEMCSSSNRKTPLSKYSNETGEVSQADRETSNFGKCLSTFVWRTDCTKQREHYCVPWWGQSLCHIALLRKYEITRCEFWLLFPIITDSYANWWL
jgi:hypothetical protein